MTPSVTDKTPIPAKVWRRHTDPPGLWIAVIVGSVSLHLLAFWLMRSSQFSRLWQQQNKAAIPIEVVEIYSQTKARARKVASKPKKVSPKPPSTSQKLREANLPKQVIPKDKLTAKSAPSTQDRSTIAFTKNKEAQAEQFQRAQAEQLQRAQAEQLQQAQAEQLQQAQAEQLQQAQAEQFQRAQAEQLQQAQAEQLQRAQAEQLQRAQAEQLQRAQAEQLQRAQAEQLQRAQAEQLQRAQAEQLQRASSQTPNAPSGTLLASLVGEPQQVERDGHNNPAKIKISDEPFPKGLEYVKFIEKKPGQPVEFTVILTISEKGKLEKIDVEDEAVPVDERSYYEDFVADQVFKGWEFEPAYDNDPNDPKPSNLMVRIRIQPLP
ncbi:hypothetical protein [aff. Roholtiella sp. LEGE 12411]|uniref:hypothetical protein n=1 Tax=aff. Roholtiella sp. LEGE 12411 TaxID=1828822 RepID=UPI0018806703|nr:hypothetical protein [aff. Roholtiella sp. LEGE 12411]MBE9034599.1 hypothetical protein [aff. Roholtiella sp. LEGE 12411]